MIPLQRPILTGSLQEQMRQMQAWAETLATQLEMVLSSIPEENLSAAVREKLNGQSQQTRQQIEEISATLQSVMNR